MNIEDYFNCPNCNGDLNGIVNGFRCINCSMNFPNKDGLPSLLLEGINTELSNIPNPYKLNQKAKKMGWETAVIEHTRENINSRDYLEYAEKQIISEAPGDFQYLLPINKESIILVIGVGWGNITCSLARNAKYIFAMDVNADLLHLLELRINKEGLKNIKLVQGASSSLPAKEKYFDAIILLGTLEQLVYERTLNSPDQMRSEFLANIFSALKPNGTFYLATENRFNFNNFLGKKETHSNLRFVTVLPCLAARYYSKMRRRMNYRCANFSNIKLRNILKDTGFVKEDFYYPIPSYQNLRYLSKLENRAVYLFLLKMLGSYPKFSLLYSMAGFLLSFFPLSILKFFWPDFCVLAKRP